MILFQKYYIQVYVLVLDTVIESRLQDDSMLYKLALENVNIEKTTSLHTWHLWNVYQMPRENILWIRTCIRRSQSVARRQTQSVSLGSLLEMQSLGGQHSPARLRIESVVWKYNLTIRPCMFDAHQSLKSTALYIIERF